MVRTDLFDYLQKTGKKCFRYTDLVIAVCIVTGYIKEASEYNWRIHRGHYSYGWKKGSYLYKPGRDGRFLSTFYNDRGQLRYEIQGTKFEKIK